jgi:hypothetical protein
MSIYQFNLTVRKEPSTPSASIRGEKYCEEKVDFSFDKNCHDAKAAAMQYSNLKLGNTIMALSQPRQLAATATLPRSG